MTNLDTPAGLSMHGTGTPLGDPIEVGAAAMALRTRTAAGGSQPQPLNLAASKSAAGHGEPASGMIGLALAAASLQQLSAAPVLHLRTLNPHIRSALEAGRTGSTSGDTATGVLVARAAAPLSLYSVEPAAFSVSSFAFQVKYISYFVLMRANTRIVFGGSPILLIDVYI